VRTHQSTSDLHKIEVTNTEFNRESNGNTLKGDKARSKVWELIKWV